MNPLAGQRLRHRDFVILRRFDAVRMMTLLPTMAGVASVRSPIEFLPSNLNSGPAPITNVSPYSLSAKIFPLYAQGDAENPLASSEIRRRPYTCSPVFASFAVKNPRSWNV
jgi:hypothetical protein